jgi:hypothetical protein
MAELTLFDWGVLAAVAWLLTDRTTHDKVRRRIMQSSATTEPEEQEEPEQLELPLTMPEKKRQARLREVEKRGDTRVEVVHQTQGYQCFLVDAAARVYSVLAMDDSSRIISHGHTYKRAYGKARDYAVLGYRAEIIHKPSGTMVLALASKKR